VACDVVGRSAGELIRFLNDVIIALEERQNIFNSTLHVVEVMRAGHPARRFLELGKDEMEKAFDMGREHMKALFANRRGQELHHVVRPKTKPIPMPRLGITPITAAALPVFA
jgi:hypothetical protein